MILELFREKRMETGSGCYMCQQKPVHLGRRMGSTSWGDEVGRERWARGTSAFLKEGRKWECRGTWLEVVQVKQTSFWAVVVEEERGSVVLMGLGIMASYPRHGAAWFLPCMSFNHCHWDLIFFRSVSLAGGGKQLRDSRKLATFPGALCVSPGSPPLCGVLLLLVINTKNILFCFSSFRRGN